MPTTEELLEQLEAEAQSETPVCIIDPDTRTITVPTEYQLFGVEGDKKVERIYFQCPKVVGDNQDLSQDYQLFINYQNANEELDAYKIDDMEVDGDNITFSWLLGEKVTKYKGNILFAFGAIKPGDDVDDPDRNRWNTTLNSDCTCLIGLESTQAVGESNPDALTQIWAAIDELKAGGGGSGTPGKDGREIELQNNGTAIRWRYVGDESWTDLVQLSDITGAKGDPGENGIIQIGTVQTLEPGQDATASMSGTPENPLLNLGIPKGEKGDPGEGSEAEPYELPIMSETQLGGGKAISKTDEDVPVAVDPETGQLFVPTYPESASADIPRQEMQNTDTTVTLEPNKLYVFPEMVSLTVTLGTPIDTNVANEYHFFFTSGATATTLTLNDVLSDAYSIEANMKYEVSILEGVACIKGVSMDEA